MKKVAVIIKHPYRDYDFRVDIVEVPQEITGDQIKAKIMAKMLGPFEIIGLTTKIDFDRKL